MAVSVWAQRAEDAQGSATRSDGTVSRGWATRYSKGQTEPNCSLTERASCSSRGRKLEYLGHGLPESFLDIAMNIGLHLEHACGGSCACTTCHLIVRKGMEHLSDMEDD